MRRLTILLKNISCHRCILPIHTALVELLITTNLPIPLPEISFEHKTAIIIVPPQISNEQIIAAIQSTGKTAAIIDCEDISEQLSREQQPSMHSFRKILLSVTPLSCMRCVSAVENAVLTLLHSSDISSDIPKPTVSLETQEIEVIIPSTISDAQLLSAITSASSKFKAEIISSTFITLPENISEDTGTSNDLVNPMLANQGQQQTCDFTASSCGSETRTSSNNTADTSRRILAVTGMTCAACVKTVSDILQTVPGVCNASVNLLTARALLTVTNQFDTANAISTLETAGYFAAEQVDVRQQQGIVYLRFINNQIAQRAVSLLNGNSVVVSAKVLTSRKIHNISTSRWHKKIPKTTSIVMLESLSKLKAVSQLSAEKISYEVIPRSDPVVSGIRSSSDMLQSHAREYSRLFYSALFFTIPLTFLTMLFSKVHALGSETLKQYVNDSGFRVIDIIALILATPVQFVCGARFYRGAWYALKKRRANMDVLISLGTSIAYGFSIVVPILRTVQKARGLPLTQDQIAFETSALIITIVLFGKWMETIAKKKTAAGVEALANIAPRNVTVVSPPPEGKEIMGHSVDVELVSVGDYFRVNPGATFPIDGRIEQGETTADESMLTGESWPVKKHEGDDVYAGTINGNSAVMVRCTTDSTDTVLEKVVNLVRHAQQSKAPVEEFADRVSAVFVPVVILIAVGVTILWFALAQTNSIPEDWNKGEGNFLFGVLFGLSVLVIACPCALGLATPTVIMMATSIGAKRMGVLYKDGGQALQAIQEVKTILFDKTGTLTIGKPSVTAVAIVDVEKSNNVTVLQDGMFSSQVQKLLQAAAMAESTSDHPLAQSIMKYAGNHCENFTYDLVLTSNETLPGRGIRCTFMDGRKVEVGKPEWILGSTAHSISLSCEGQKLITDWEMAGRTVVLSHVINEPLIVFGIEDPVRTESADVVSYLRSRGITCCIVTGDGLGTATNVARKIGIEEQHVRARAMPADKVDVVNEFAATAQENKKTKQNTIIFVGDGINDAAALSAATVGIAMGCSSQVASESAGIVLVKSNLWDVVTAVDLAKAAFRRIRINYLWAFCFNTLAIPLAAGAVYPILQTRIPPYAAAAAMALSSVTVVLSSLSLSLYKSPSLRTSELR